MQPGSPGTQPYGAGGSGGGGAYPPGGAGGKGLLTIVSGRRQTSGLHTRKRLLSHSEVHVNRKRQTESAAYTWFWWLTAKSVNLVAMSPQSLTQLMLSTVIQSPSLEFRTRRR